MNKNSQTKIQRFLDWAKKQNRGTQADLRRGFSSGTEHRCWPYIARYCDLYKDRDRIIWQTIAAGFATYEGTGKSGNFGITMRRLALDGATGNAEDALKSFDARFRRILTCSKAKEVCQHYPVLFGQLKIKIIFLY